MGNRYNTFKFYIDEDSLEYHAKLQISTPANCASRMCLIYKGHMSLDYTGDIYLAVM